MSDDDRALCHTKPYSPLSAAEEIKVEVPDGDPLWATAAVAVVAALLGSAVGGYASFRANYALERSRRRARSQIRRKSKIYTPIRSELVALREACGRGVHLGHWLIVREIPPPVITRPASLHLWKDLVDDGRAQTAASRKVARLLDHVDACADALNREVLDARTTFEERGQAILQRLGRAPVVANWVESDTAALLLGRFDDLGLLGTGFGEETPPEVQSRFGQLWTEDPEVAKATADVGRVDSALQAALDDAITELDRAMQRIADKHENESPHD